MAVVNTQDVALHLGTDAKILRRFLRSPSCPFATVGSGSRYTFTRDDLDELTQGFRNWSKGKNVSPATPTTVSSDPEADQRARDKAVWDEEGPIIIPDIRDPRVRAHVRAVAAAQEARLNSRLLARGQHITQRRSPEVS